MSTTVNISGIAKVRDSHYRYQMPALFVRADKKNTFLVNLDELVGALNCAAKVGDDLLGIQCDNQAAATPDVELIRDSHELMKFFSVELNVQSKCADSGQGKISGVHDSPRLQRLLSRYIQLFVLCGVCGGPETKYIKSDSGDLFKKCYSCPSNSLCDVKHKLTKHILKRFSSNLLPTPAPAAAATKPSSAESAPCDNALTEAIEDIIFFLGTLSFPARERDRYATGLVRAGFATEASLLALARQGEETFSRAVKGAIPDCDSELDRNLFIKLLS